MGFMYRIIHYLEMFRMCNQNKKFCSYPYSGYWSIFGQYPDDVAVEICKTDKVVYI
jgi:hypothetical protein